MYAYATKHVNEQKFEDDCDLTFVPLLQISGMTKELSRAAPQL